MMNKEIVRFSLVNCMVLGFEFSGKVFVGGEGFEPSVSRPCNSRELHGRSGYQFRHPPPKLFKKVSPVNVYGFLKTLQSLVKYYPKIIWANVGKCRYAFKCNLTC